MLNNIRYYLTNRNIQDGLAFFAGSIGLTIYSFTKHYGTIKMEWKTSPYLFPIIISIIVVLISISLLKVGVKQVNEESGFNNIEVDWKGVAVTVVAMLVYSRIMKLVTFIPATIGFLMSMFYYLGERRIWLMALISIIGSLSIYLIFGILLKVMLP